MVFKCSINYVFSIIKPTLVNGLDEIRTMCYLDVLVRYCLRNFSKSIKFISQLNNLFGATRIVHCGFIINWEFHCQTNNLQGTLRSDKKNNWATRTIYFCYMSRDNIFRNFIDGILIFTSCVSISYARQRLWNKDMSMEFSLSIWFQLKRYLKGKIRMNNNLQNWLRYKHTYL